MRIVSIEAASECWSARWRRPATTDSTTCTATAAVANPANMPIAYSDASLAESTTTSGKIPSLQTTFSEATDQLATRPFYPTTPAGFSCGAYAPGLLRLHIVAYVKCMSRTNVDIDDQACAVVMRRYGLATKRDAINFALRKLAAEPASVNEARALRGIGWEGDLEAMRSNRRR